MELSLPVKATLGVGSAASAAAGGIYLTSSSEGSSTENQTEDTKDSDQNSIPSNKPEKDILVTDPKTGSLYYQNEEFKSIESSFTVGSRYAIYLISPTHDETTWKQKFEALKKDNTKDPLFQDITVPKKQNDPKSLSSVCLSIYKLPGETGLMKEYNKHESSTLTVNESLTNSFWKYCSYLDEAPVLIPFSESYQRTKIYETYYSQFVTEDSKNNKLWEFKQAWYDQLKDKDKPKDIKFKSYLASKQNETKEGGSFSLKKLCKLAINENPNGEKITPLEVLYYCSYERQLFSERFAEDGINDPS